jgi:hypothetical protein
VRSKDLIRVVDLEVIFAAHVDEETVHWTVGIADPLQDRSTQVNIHIYDAMAGR